MPSLTKSIKIPLNSHKRANEAAAKLGLGLGEFCSAAIDYFAERGLDPTAEMSRPTEVMVAEIRKLGHRLFGFLQEQERGVLLPILAELIRTRALTEEAVDFSLQAMVKVYGDETFLEQGRARSRDRVEKKVNTLLRAANEVAPSKGGR